MRFRKLRIAWSATCGIACVLLIVLWVRSYQNVEELNRTSESAICTYILSDSGTVSFGRQYIEPFESFLPPEAHGWRYAEYGPNLGRHVKRFTFEWSAPEVMIRAPAWFLALFPATLATLPWIKWRFTLRTLLVATTLVAVVLGLIVYMTWQ
jgi:hypothetical protein